MKDFPKIGPTVTMFVPYDCNNACPFCVNKKEYSDTSEFNLERCYQSLDFLDRVFPHNDVVLTGGEPLANLECLQDILDHISEGHHVYINTTLPIAEGQDPMEVINTLNKYADKISCINISRHLEHYVKECPDELLNKLKMRHRINCVIFKSADDPETKEKMASFLERFEGHEIQFRANYSYLTLDNVFVSEGDSLFRLIGELCEYKRPLEIERFRTGFEYDYKGTTITYHKTLPFAKVDGVVGDIIIRQTGRIYDDWNEYGHELNANDLVTLQYK